MANKHSLNRKHGSARIALAAGVGIASMLSGMQMRAALGAASTWNASSGGPWSTASDWAPAAVPTSSAGTDLLFGGGSYTATQDAATTFSLSSIGFSNTGAVTLAQSASDVIQFVPGSGYNPYLADRASGNVTISSPVTWGNSSTGISASITNSGTAALSFTGNEVYTLGSKLTFTNSSSGSITFGNAPNYTQSGTAGTTGSGVVLTLINNSSAANSFVVPGGWGLSGTSVANATTVVIGGTGTVSVGQTSGGIFGLDNLDVLSGATFNFDNNGEGMGAVYGAGTISGGTTGAAISVGTTGYYDFSGSLNIGTGTFAVAAAGLTQRLSGSSSTYTGATSVTGGTLSVGANAPSGSAGALGNSTSAVLVGGTTGSLAASLLIDTASVTIGRAISLQTGNTGIATLGGTNTSGIATFSGNVTMGTGSSAAKGLTVTAAIGGSVIFSGSLLRGASVTGTADTLTKVGGGIVTLQGADTFTGATSINAGTLQLDYTANSATKLSSTAGLTLAGGSLDMLGNGSGASGETVNGLTLGSSATSGGGGRITLTAGNNENITLAIGTIATRNIGATVDFGLTNSGSGVAAITTTTSNVSNILGGYATFGTTDWAANNSGNIGALASYDSTFASGKNNSISLSTALAAGGGTANSLRFNGTAALTFNAAGDTLTLQSGGILVSSNVTGATSIGAVGTAGKLASGVNELIVNQWSTGGALTINSVISGATSLTKSGSGTLILAGASNYTGTNYINGGTLQVGATANLGAATTPIVINGGTLSLPTGNIGTIAAAVHPITVGPDGATFNFAISQTTQGAGLSGSGDLTKIGGGQWSVGTSGSSFAGNLFINGGTLRMTSAGLTHAASMTVGAGAEFLIDDNAAGTYALTAGARYILNADGGGNGAIRLVNTSTAATFTTKFSNEVVLNSASTLITNTIAPGATTGTLEFDGNITGTGGFSKNGPGPVVLTAANNSYTGATAIQAGTLQIALGSDRLPISTSLTLGTASTTTSGVLDLNSFSQTIGGLTTAGTGTANDVINSSATATSVLTVNLASGSQTFAGTLGGTGTNNNNLGFAKAGAGTLTLANTAVNGNTFTGALTLSGGTLQFSADNNLGSITSPNTVIFNGGTLEDLGTAAIAPSAHTFEVNATGGTLQLDGTAGSGSNLQFAAGNLIGSGTLTKAGTSNLVLLGDNPSFSGAWNIGSGFVEAKSDNALGNAAASNSVTIGGSGELVGNATTIGNNINLNAGGALSANSNQTFSGNMTVSGAVSLIPSDYLDTTSRTMVISGPISNGSSAGAVTISSTNNGNVGSGGTLIMTGSSTYTGGTTISGAILQIGNGGATGSITGNVLNNGALVFNRTRTVTFPGTISGNGSVANNGVGTLALTVSNSYSGTTAVNAGTLQFTGGTTQLTSGVTVANGAALSVANASTANTVSLSLGGLTFGSTATDATTLNFATGASWNTTTPLISLGGALTENGTTTINLGTLTSIGVGTYELISYTGSSIGGTNGFGGFSVTQNFGPRTRANLQNVAGILEVQIQGDSPVWSGANGGIWDVNNTQSWNLIQAQTPTVYLEGDTVLFDDTAGSGNTSVTLNTTVNPTSVTFNNSTNNYAVSGSGSIAGATGVVLTGTGTVILATSNTYSGGTTINSGATLQLGNGGVSGSVTSNIANSGAVVYDRTDSVIAGYNISGNGSVSQQGSGTVIVTGSWTHTGGTTITNGSLQIGNGGTAGSIAGAISGTGTLVLDRSDSVSYSNALSGALNVTVNSGAGPTTITNGINYSGSAAVTNNSSNILSLGAMTYGAGVTTTYAGSGNITSAAVQNFASNASVVYTGSGTLALGTTAGAGMAFGSGTVNITNGVNSGGSTGVLHLVDGGTFSGSGTVNLYNYNPAANSFTIGDMAGVTGTLNIAAGVVIAANTGGDLFGNSLTLNVASGATFDFNSNAEGMGGISGSGTIQGNAAVTPEITGHFIWAGNFAGTGAFTEATGVDYIFTGVNTSTGLITVPANTTFAVGNGTTGSIVAGISNAGAVTFNTSTNNTYAGVITGAGAVNVTGIGTTNFSTTSTYTGVTTVSNGTLQVAANTTHRPYTVNSGAGMIFTNNDITSSFATSVFSVGSTGGNASLTFQFNGGLPTLSQSIVNVAAAGGLNLNGTITVNIAGTTAFTTGQYPLISYSGLVQGDGFGALTLGSLPFRTAGSLVNDTTNSSIDVSLTADGIKWNGNVPGANWNTTDANWTLDIEGTPTTYQEAGVGLTDTAVFDNTATGSYTVNIPGIVSPNGVNVIGASYTFQGSGKISGATGLLTSGAGTTLTLLTDNDYSGGTIIGAGSTLQVGNGGTTGSITGAISGSGTLVLDRSDVNLSLGNTLSGALNVTQNGTGTVTLTGTNTQTGTLTLNSGTIAVAGQANLGSVAANGLAVHFNGGTLAITGSAYSTSTGIQVFTIGSNGGTVQVSPGNIAAKTGDGLVGSGTLTISGGGALAFESSGNSTFTGDVNLNGGALAFTSLRLPTMGNVTTNNGTLWLLDTATFGTFSIGSGKSLILSGDGDPSALPFVPASSLFQANGAYLHTLSEAGSSTATINVPITLAATARFTETAGTNGTRAPSDTITDTFPQVISGPGGLVKDGEGTMVLGAAETYGGSTTISNGTIRISGTGNLPSGTTLQLGETGVSNSGAFDLNGLSQTVAGLTTGGTGTANKVINSSTTAATLTVSYSGSMPQTFSGVLGGASNVLNFASIGSGNLILSGSNVYTGTTAITGGTLTAGSPAAFGSTNAAVTVNTGGTLDLAGQTLLGSKPLSLAGGSLINSSTTASSTAGFASINMTASSSVGGNGNLSISPPLTASGAYGLTVVGSGTTTLLGNNLYSGGTTVSLGSNLQIGNGGSTGSISGSVVNNGTLTFNRNDSSTISLTGLSGNGSLTQNGTNTLQIPGGATIGGGLTVNAGTLSVVNTGVTVPVSLASSALTFGTGSTTLNLQVGTSWTNTTPLLNVGNLSDIGTTTVNLNSLGAVSNGTYQLIDYTSGSVGSSFHQGTFTLAARQIGTLVTTAPGVIELAVSGDSPVWTGTAGGASNGSWDTSTQNWNLVVAGGPTAYQQGDAILFDDTATGTTNITLAFAAAPAAVTFNNSSLTYTISGSGKITGSTGITLSGSGTVVLATINDFTGLTTISNGTLQLGNAAAAGNVAGAIINNGVLVYNEPSPLIATSGISGSGSVTVAGNSTLTITGDWSHTGGTTINGGATLQIGSGGTVGSVPGDIINNGALIFDRTDTTIYTGNLSGSGITTISAGTLQIGSGISGTVGTNLVDNATLVFGRSDSTSYGGTISGTGKVSQQGAGTLTLSGNNTYTGVTTFGAGTVSVAALSNGGVPSPIGMAPVASANLVFAGGSLQYTGSSVAINRGFTLGTGGGTIDIPDGATNLTISGVVAGTTSLTKIGAGALSLTNTNSETGTLNLNAGVVSVAGQANLGSMAANGLGVDFNGGTLAITGSSYSTSTGIQIFNMGFAGGTLQISPGNVAVKTGDGIAGSGTLNITGGGTLSIQSSGGSGFTGAVDVSNGAIRFTSQRFPNAGNFNISPGGTVWLFDTTSFTTTSQFAIGAGNSLTLSGNGDASALPTVSASGAFLHTLDEAGSANAGINIPIILAATARFTETAGTSGTRTTSDTVTDTFNQPISGPGGLVKDGEGTMVLAAAETYGVTTTISNGTIRLSGTGSLPTGTALQFGEASSNHSGTFDLNGVTQALTGLATAGTGTASQVINSSATPVALNVNYSGSTPQTFAGQIGGGTQAVPANNNIAVTIAGGGVFMLAGAGTYSGNTAIENGTLILGTSPNSIATTGSLNPATSVALGSGTNGATLQLGDATNPVNQAITSLSTSGTGTANAIVGGFANTATPSILTINNNTPATFSGTLGGNGANQNNLGLTVNGGSTLTLTGSNTYTGPTNVQNGTVILGTRTGAPTGVLSSQTALMLGNAPGTTSGVLQLGDALNAVNQTVASLNSNSTNSAIVGGSPSAISTLTVMSSGTDNFAGNLGGTGAAANNLALTFSGNSLSGYLGLSGNNTYVGNTTITSGTLALATSLASNIAFSPNVLVGDTPAHAAAILDITSVFNSDGFHVVGGQTLSGFGSINTGGFTSGGVSFPGNTVNVDSGATIAPGSSTVTGTLTINGNTILAAGGAYVWKLDPTTAGTSTPTQDELLLGQGGVLLIPDPNAGAGTFNLNITRFGANPSTTVAPGTTFIVAEAPAVEIGSNYTPVTGDVTSSFTVTDTTSGPGETWTVSVEPDANFAANGLYDVDLTTVTPEPGSLGLLGLASLGLLRRRRRQPNCSIMR